MQITIQKKYIVIYEIADNIFAVFLVMVNFVFDVVVSAIEHTIENSVQKIRNYLQALFGFNIYKLQVVKINNKLDNLDNNLIKNKNESFLRYSNLLAPPKF